MLNKLLKAVIAAVVLSASSYANIASAVPINTTYDWSASCYDCKGDIRIRPDDPDLWTTVTGSITLADYTIGDTFGMEAFVGFTYEGPSNHVVPFNVTNESCMSGTCLANVSGKLFDSNNFFIELTFAQFDIRTTNTLLQLAKRIESYNNPNLQVILSIDERQVIAANACIQYAEPSIVYDNCFDEEIFELNRIADVQNYRNARIIQKYMTLVARDKRLYNAYFFKFAKHKQHVKFDLVNADWDIGDGLISKDYGTNARYNEVAEPGVLAILALGLMGLSLRRFKKLS